MASARPLVSVVGLDGNATGQVRRSLPAVFFLLAVVKFFLRRSSFRRLESHLILPSILIVQMGSVAARSAPDNAHALETNSAVHRPSPPTGASPRGFFRPDPF